MKPEMYNIIRSYNGADFKHPTYITIINENTLQYILLHQDKYSQTLIYMRFLSQ